MFINKKMFSVSVSFLALLIGAHAEMHTVHFENSCGFGTPTLIQGSKVLSTGKDYTSNGPLISAIAYLQTGSCGFNGEGCTVIELTLVNPTTAGNGSSADISVIPPYEFSVASGFGYFDGCDGAGADCTDPVCPTPIGPPEPRIRKVYCDADNVNFAITFCN